jgi:hypothetical protein
VVDMGIFANLVQERTREFLQIVIVFWLLAQGHPLTNLEAMKLF